MIFAVGICEGGDVFVYYSKPRYKVPVKCSRNAEEVGDKKPSKTLTNDIEMLSKLSEIL